MPISRKSRSAAAMLAGCAMTLLLSTVALADAGSTDASARVVDDLPEVVVTAQKRAPAPNSSRLVSVVTLDTPIGK